MSTGTTTSYYLYLTPWGKFTDVEKIDVPAYVYNSLEKNDQVQIGVHKGKLGIPWLTITK